MTAEAKGSAREQTGWQGRYFEDFEVGDVYRHPLGRTLTATDNSWLTLLTQNTAPLHFDAHYAAQTSWRRPLVNSTITLALVTGQSVTDVSQHVFANLGWDEVRLPAPVFEGDTIYSHSTVLEKRESGSRPDVGIVRIETEGLNQDGLVVISFRRTMMVFRRGHGPDAAAPAAPPPTSTPAARSWLFVPGDRPERFDKAAASEADTVILDLEDGVAPEAKAAARRNVAAWLGEPGRHAWVRIAAASTTEWAEDLEALAPPPDGLLGIMLAKCEHPGEVAATIARLPMPVVALVETAAGIESAAEIAHASGVVALALGVADLGRELGLGADPLAWAYPRSRLVVASRAAGLGAPIDGPTMRLDDPATVTADAGRAREFGFGGKLCIHPRQAVAVNAALAPSDEEVAWARIVVGAASGAGGGAVRVDGEMVDRPRLERARAILTAAGEAPAEPAPEP